MLLEELRITAVGPKPGAPVVKPDLRHARLSRHRRLAQQARREAQAFLDADPGLESAEAQLMAIEARRMFGDEVDWLTRA